MLEHTPTALTNCCAVLGNVAMQRLICVERSRKSSQTRHSVDTNVLLTFPPGALPPPPAASFSPVSLSPPATDKYTLHLPFSLSLSLLLQKARNTHYIVHSLSLFSCNRQQVHLSPPPQPPHPPPATSKKYTLHFPLALSLLLQQPTSTRCIFLCQSFCPCDTQQVHITFPLGSASPPATDNEYTLHLPFFLSSCRNRQQVHIRSSLLSLLLQQATSTHYIFPPFSPLATGNMYTLHLPYFLPSCNRQQVHMTSSLVSVSPSATTEQH